MTYKIANPRRLTYSHCCSWNSVSFTNQSCGRDQKRGKGELIAILWFALKEQNTLFRGVELTGQLISIKVVMLHTAHILTSAKGNLDFDSDKIILVNKYNELLPTREILSYAPNVKWTKWIMQKIIMCLKFIFNWISYSLVPEFSGAIEDGERTKDYCETISFYFLC